MWSVWIVLVFIMLIVLVISTKLSITFYLLHAQDNDFIRVTVKAWKVFSYTSEIPLMKADDDSASLVIEKEKKQGEKQSTEEKEEKITLNEIKKQIEKIEEFFDHVKGLHHIIKRFLAHVTITKLEWHSGFGTGDAASTGMFIGGLWSLKGGIIALLDKFLSLEGKPNVHITPHFQELFSRTELRCIFSLRVWHAIGAAILIVKYWKNSDRGGKQHVRASDSRLNENRNGKFERNG